MGFLEVERYRERLVLPRRAQEADRILGHYRRQVPDLAIDLLAEVDALRDTEPVVELIIAKRESSRVRRWNSNRELPNERSTVTCVAERHRIGPRHLLSRQGAREVLDAVPPHMVAGQDRSTAATADGGCDERVLEARALGGQTVQVRSAQYTVSGSAQIVVPQIVPWMKSRLGGLAAAERATLADAAEALTFRNCRRRSGTDAPHFIEFDRRLQRCSVIHQDAQTALGRGQQIATHHRRRPGATPRRHQRIVLGPGEHRLSTLR